MGRRIRGQRRGRGTPTFRAPSHRYKADLQHRKVEDGDVIAGTVVDIEHDPARSAPIAAVEFDDGDQRLVLAPEGIGVGDEIQVGVSAEIAPGNTLPLAEIPEGVPVCNIEAKQGDGGKFARARCQRPADQSRSQGRDRQAPQWGVQASGPAVSGHDRRGRWRWPDGETAGQSREETPQGESARPRLAAGPWCGDERRRPPLRWRWPPAPWQAQIHLPERPAGSESRGHLLAAYRPRW